MTSDARTFALFRTYEWIQAPHVDEWAMLDLKDLGSVRVYTVDGRPGRWVATFAVANHYEPRATFGSKESAQNYAEKRLREILGDKNTQELITLRAQNERLRDYVVALASGEKTYGDVLDILAVVEGFTRK